MTSTTITIDQQHADEAEAVRAEVVAAKNDVATGRLMKLDDLRSRVAARRRQQRTTGAGSPAVQPR